MSTHVFLSYCETEAAFALRLAADLKNAGVNLWMDRFDVQADWRQSVQRAVTDSAVFLLVLSPDYLASKYGQRELSQATRMGIPIICVLPAPLSEWPAHLKNYQSVDFSQGETGETLRKLLDMLKQCAPQQLQTAPTPEVQYTNQLLVTLETQSTLPDLFTHIPTCKAAHQALDIRPAPAQSRHLPAHYTLRETGNSTAQQEYTHLNEVAQQHPRFVLLGSPGAGKTYSIRLLAREAIHRYWEAPRIAPLPLLIDLHAWDEDLSLVEFIRSCWPLPSDPIKALSQGRITLYLDGLSDSQHQKSFSKKVELLNEWINGKSAPQRVVITCRPDDYTEAVQFNLPVVTIDGIDLRQAAEQHLDANEAQLFINRVLSSQGSRLQHYLAQNPLLVNLQLTLYPIYSENEAAFSAGSLLRLLVTALWEEQSAVNAASTFEQVESALAKLALRMVDAQVAIYMPVQEAAGYAGDEALLHTAAQAHLLELKNSEVRFSHDLVKQYFAALGLKNIGLTSRLKPPQLDGAYRRIPTRWDAVNTILVGILSDPEAAVLSIANVDPYLALQCLVYNPHVRQETYQTVLDQLTGSVHIEGDYRLGVANLLTLVDSKGALVILLEIMRDGSAPARQAAAAIFKRVEIEPLSGLTSALKELDDTNRDAARGALRVLRAEALPTLLHLLGHTHWHTRRGAAWALGELKDRTAVPLLIQALQDEDHIVCVEACFALGQIGDSMALPALVSTLRHTNWRVSRAASQALIHIGDDCLPHLVEVLKNRASPTRQRVQAIDILGHLRKAEAAAVILKLTRSRNVEERYAAVNALKMHPSQAATKRLIECLADEDKPRWSRWRICDLAAAILETVESQQADQALRKWQQKQSAAGSGKTAKLRLQEIVSTDTPGRDWASRRDAVVTLVAARPSTAVPRLITALDDEDPQVKIAAINTLVRFKDDPRVLPALFQVLEDEDHIVCDTARDAIKKIAQAPVSGLPGAIRSASLNARAAAIDIAGAVGDQTVISDLIESLADVRRLWLSDQRICDIAAEALQSINTEEALEAVQQWRRAQPPSAQSASAAKDEQAERRPSIDEIFEALHSGDWGVRQEASKALNQHAKRLRGTSDPILAQRLVRELSSPDWSLRCAAVEALAWLRDQGSAQAIALLTKDENWMVRSAAVRALAEIGSPSSAETVSKVLSDPSSMVREAAAEALGRLGSPGALPNLVNALSDVEPFVRLAAIEALGNLKNPSAVEPLRRQLDDDDLTTRWYVAEAFRKIAHPSTVVDLIVLLNDTGRPAWETQSVANVAAKALQTINTPEAWTALIAWQTAVNQS